MRSMTGDIEQVPSSVSAIKVDGVRAYKRVRDGETVQLKSRPVTVSEFDVLTRRADEIDVHVECSTGTYIRALARDLGEALGVGAHLTALRRTRVGSYPIGQAKTLEELATTLTVVPLAAAAADAFPRIDVSDADAERISHGQRLVLAVAVSPSAVFAPDGHVVALVEDRDGVAQPTCVFAGPAQ
jgi:tRNA pseudouridine55 synthase